MLNTPAALNSTLTKLIRGDYVAVCIYQCTSFIPDKISV